MKIRARHLVAAAFVLTGAAGGASAQVKWDLPSGYPPANFHTENLQRFANDVDKATGGKLKLTIHSNGSLFKANDIKRAVQGGQAQVGEFFISNFGNEETMLNDWLKQTGAEGKSILNAYRR